MKPYIKTILLITTYFSFSILAPQANEMVSQNALLKINAEEITLPENEALGWVGTSYLLEAYPDFFIGGSLYGAATGDRGGFFSIGSEFTWTKNWQRHWFTNLGIYIGGGGGGSANKLVGGGLVIRPHIDFFRDFNQYQIGFSFSQVKFPSGTISSQQVGLVFNYRNNFYHSNEENNTSIFDFTSDNLPQHSGLGFDRILGTSAIYKGQLQRQTQTKQVAMLGMRAEHYFASFSYMGIEVVGAAKGDLGGYGEYMATLGVTYPILENKLSIGGRVGMGMAGGGGAATQGGLISKLGANLDIHLFHDYQLSLEAGYVIAPMGEMKAKYAGINLIYELNKLEKYEKIASYNQYEWQIGTITYNAVIPSNSPSSVPLTGVEIRVNRFINQHLYHGLQIMYAAQGSNYGGYGHTFADIGYKSSAYKDFSLSAELAAGGGGGASISVGGGALYMGNIYLDYKLNNDLNIRLGAGQLKALKGSLNTTVSELLITYNYQTLDRQ
ncbi:MAG: hypothetical protein R8M14_08115 [Ghiorsea sp.]